MVVYVPHGVGKAVGVQEDAGARRQGAMYQLPKGSSAEANLVPDSGQLWRMPLCKDIVVTTSPVHEVRTEVSV